MGNAQRTLWFEVTLSWRRIFRRKAQSGLLLMTFAISTTLSLLSWSIFRNVFLSSPDFDPRGEYWIMTYVEGKLGSQRHSTYAELEAIKGSQDVFSDFADVGLYASVFVRTPDGAERSQAAYLSAHALRVLGARPLSGRLFTQEEDVPRGPRAVLMSQRMWENSYYSDPDIVGKAIEVTGAPATIVGILPASFRFPNNQDLWLSMSAVVESSDWPVRDALVKLKQGTGKRRAEQDIQLILNQLGPESPANKNALKPALLPFRDIYLQPEIRVSSLILFILSLTFVGATCVNAANLLYADFLERRNEIAAAIALGVPRIAVLRTVSSQLFFVSAVATSIACVAVQVVGPYVYNSIRIVNAPYWLRYRFEFGDLVVAAGIGLLSAAVALIAPLAYLSSVKDDDIVRENMWSGRGAASVRWRRLLLACQIALLTVLGICSSLLVTTNYKVSELHWGYNGRQVFLGKISALSIDYPQGVKAGRLATHRKVLEEIERRPETAAAAFADDVPGYSRPANCTYSLNPAAFNENTELGKAFNTRVTEDFFKTLDVPIVKGAIFQKEMRDDEPDYVIINNSLALRLWPGADPLHRALYIRSQWMKDTDPPLRVIVTGVVRDYQANGPLAKNNDLIFSPYKSGAGSSVFVLVRDHSGLPNTRALQLAVHKAEPREALYFPSTIAEQVDQMLGSIRLTSKLTVLAAAIAGILCTIGIYGVALSQLMRSSHDFGIRLALGAEPVDLWLTFVRSQMLTTIIGVAIGALMAIQFGGVLGSLIYGVSPYDPVIYSGVCIAIVVITGLACIPCLFKLRRIEPAECLRSI